MSSDSTPGTPARNLNRWVIALTAALTLAGACSSGQPPETAITGAAMGTTYSVKVAGAADQAALRDIVDGQLTLVDDAMSTYKPDSELSRFNQFDSTGPFPLSPASEEVFGLALEVSRLTGGAFDVTVAELVNAWGFGPDGRVETAPSEEELARLLATSGWEKLHLDEVHSTLSKSDPAIQCDLSGIAKGYAVDRVAGALTAAGFDRFMVEVGGEVRTLGRNPDGVAWRIGIERPIEGGRAVYRVVGIEGLGMATSGDYRNFSEVGGARVTHIIDPSTGRPTRHRLASVSVIDPNTARADAFATALMVLGEDSGYQLATNLDLAALLLVHTPDGGVEPRATPRFTALFGDGEQ